MKWGTTNLNVLPETYIPPDSEVVINEMQLIPGADNLEPASVVQGGGRSRDRVEFEGFVRSWAEYVALKTDKRNHQVRSFEGADGYVNDMVITNLKPVRRAIYPYRLYYSITFMEV